MALSSRDPARAVCLRAGVLALARAPQRASGDDDSAL
jgi:hypothetical protein